MGYCKFCGKELDNGATFCPHCMQKQVEEQKVIIVGNSDKKKYFLIFGVVLAMVSLAAASIVIFWPKNVVRKADNDIPTATQSEKEKIPAEQDLTSEETVQTDSPKQPEQTETSKPDPDLVQFIKKWEGFYGMDRSITMDIFDMDRNYKIKGLLTLTDQDGKAFQQNFDVSPDGEGNYYMLISADQEYELWFYFQDEQTISFTIFYENGGSVEASMS